MPYFLLEIDNAAIRAGEEFPSDPDPLVRWPWLDPFWGIVDEFVEGAFVRDSSARRAELIVLAEPDFLARWNFGGAIIKGCYPTGEMIVDAEGTIHHVTTTKRTELTGMFAHGLFAQMLPSRIDDIECELYSRAEEFVSQRIKNHLGPGDQWDETDILTATIRCLAKVDLFAADYADIYDCTQEALRFFIQSHPPSEDSI